MPANTLLLLIVGTSAFVLVAALWSIGLLLFGSRQRQRRQALRMRLGLLDQTPRGSRTLRLWHDGREAHTSVTRLPGIGTRQRLTALCRDAGFANSPRFVVPAVLGLALAATTLTLLLSGKALLGAAAGLGVCAGFWAYLQTQIARRKKLFETQFIDALELAARSLRVGHPLLSAFRLIAKEINAPIGPFFGNIVQQQELGVPLDQAMQGAAMESNSEDLRLFATSIVIQLRSGGNLADMMERIVAVIQDRLRLARRVRVLISQTQISKRILMTLPVFLFFLLNLINPQYMRPLYTTPGGMIILAIAGGGLLMGWLLINRLSIIRY
jgi:tight adherence protein B